MAQNPLDNRHGTRTGYEYGCRCDRCLEAHRNVNRMYRKADRERKKTLLEQKRLYVRLKESAKSQTVHIHGIGDVKI